MQGSVPPNEPLPPVKSLILDAGPLLSLSPLRGLASRYLTVPSVLAELRDPNARAHWENLKLISGVEVLVREPDALAMSRVRAWARHTGDLSVLSGADLEVLALTCAVEVEENGYRRLRRLPGEQEERSVAGPSGGSMSAQPTASPPSASNATPAPLTHIQIQSRPPPKSPWAVIPKPEAFDLSTQPAQELDEDEASWAEDAQEGEEEVRRREEVMDALRRAELREGSDEGADGCSDGEDEEGEEKDVQTQERIAEPTEETPATTSPPASSTTASTSNPPTSGPSGSQAIPALPLAPAPRKPFEPVYAEEPFSDQDEDDDAGEWITPSNVVHKKAVDLGMAPPSASPVPNGSASADKTAEADVGVVKTSGKAAKKAKKLAAIAAAADGSLPVRQRNHKMKSACMTGDYAVQNVLLQMGLNLVGEEGKRIEMVKSWVLRCHACFKICKDPAKKFCPSCGNASLIRASVTTSLDPITGEATQNVHLKSNFQYRTRGTKYSIPDPKMGSAKGQQRGGSGLILREDQREYQLGVRKETIRREKEERKLDKAVKAMEAGKGGGTGSWNDPDWMPEILVVGLSGKGRQGGGDFLPQIGHGRRNPNQVKRGNK